MEFRIPYGKNHLSFLLPDGLEIEVVEPAETPAVPDPLGEVEAALAVPVGSVDLMAFRGARSVAIAINDKTRPVPNQHLLPPMLARLEDLGLTPKAIRFIVATGVHSTMSPEEFFSVLPEEILTRYLVGCHDADDRGNLVHLGTTSRGTPVWVNRSFVEADLRIVVGNIQPHQFQGFTGGVKGAAIGLAGRETINHNHAMMVDPGALLGHFANNPARQDVEEIGQRIGVHFALNAVLNQDKEIAAVFAGEPRAVLLRGIPVVRRLSQVPVSEPFDLVIASPGGHPEDINLYQSQKALAHAALVTRDGGTVILVAACPEGVGSMSYERWVEGMTSHESVIQRFKQEGFRVGPHKAFQIARDAARLRVLVVSQMRANLVRRLLLTPASSLDEAISQTLGTIRREARVGVMPRSSATIPTLEKIA